MRNVVISFCIYKNGIPRLRDRPKIAKNQYLRSIKNVKIECSGLTV